MSGAAKRTIPALVAAALLLAGCSGTLQRLSEVGGVPEITPSGDPTKDKQFRTVSLPMPAPQAAMSEPGALWRPGSRAFFRDQRAAAVGDILTVLVNITDAADLKNASNASRNGNEAMGVPNLFGLEKSVPHLFAGAPPSSLVNTNSSNANAGTGEIKRAETVTLRVAGVITQVLPNGNLVVAARQQVRVNAELRELQVSGVARPQDIASDNTVLHDRLAEARIAYGGRGQLSDVQSPRYGQQLLDIVLPF